MDFWNRTRSADRRKVQGKLIQNLHLANQLVNVGNERWSPSGARGQAVQTSMGTAALAAEQGIDSVPNRLSTPKTMSAFLKPERASRTDPGMKVVGTLKSQLVSKAVEPHVKAMDGDKSWRHEAQNEATKAALEGGVRKGTVRRINKKYTPKKTRRQR
jgi:hypothetical protein